MKEKYRWRKKRRRQDCVNISQTKGGGRYHTKWQWREFAKILRWLGWGVVELNERKKQKGERWCVGSIKTAQPYAFLCLQYACKWWHSWAIWNQWAAIYIFFPCRITWNYAKFQPSAHNTGHPSFWFSISLSPFSRCTKVRLAPIFLISANPSLYSRLWKGEVMSCVQNFSNALCRQTAWEKTFDLVPGSDKKQTDPRVCRRRDLDLSFGTQLRYRSYKEAATWRIPEKHKAPRELCFRRPIRLLDGEESEPMFY